MSFKFSDVHKRFMLSRVLYGFMTSLSRKKLMITGNMEHRGDSIHDQNWSPNVGEKVTFIYYLGVFTWCVCVWMCVSAQNRYHINKFETCIIHLHIYINIHVYDICSKYPPWNLTQPLKMDGWNTILSYWVSASFFRGYVSFREGTVSYTYIQLLSLDSSMLPSSSLDLPWGRSKLTTFSCGFANTSSHTLR